MDFWDNIARPRIVVLVTNSHATRGVQMAITFVLILGIAFTLITDLSIAESDATDMPPRLSANIQREIELLASGAASNWDEEWAEYYEAALSVYTYEFTELFNSYETKIAKNGRMMIRQGDTGSFKFAKKGN